MLPIFRVTWLKIYFYFIPHCPCCPQLSKHSPDQCKSVLPATLYQCHSKDLSERRQRLSVSQCHCLLHSRLPLPRTTKQQLWYNSSFFLYTSKFSTITKTANEGIFQYSPFVPTTELWVSAMLDDRKLSARALFDDSSHRQTQLAVQVHTGQTICYKLPFHVYVSVCKHTICTVTQTHLPGQSETSQTFVSIFHRTQQIIYVQLAFHCDLKSTTQRVVRCWMRAGQLLSRNM